MRFALLALLCLFAGCKHYIDGKDTVVKKHLMYNKNTDKLVDGDVISRTKGGVIMDKMHYEHGKAVGDYYQYDEEGKIVSHGFGLEMIMYEKPLYGVDLSNCILSITEIKGGYEYASLSINNEKLFDDRDKLMQLTKCIFSDYADKYNIDELLIFSEGKECTISQEATQKTNYIVDTISGSKWLKIRIH